MKKNLLSAIAGIGVAGAVALATTNNVSTDSVSYSDPRIMNPRVEGGEFKFDFYVSDDSKVHNVYSTQDLTSTNEWNLELTYHEFSARTNYMTYGEPTDTATNKFYKVQRQ